MRKRTSVWAVLVVTGTLSLVADATPLPVYPKVINYNTPVDAYGCATYGDVVSCSATLLNLLHGQNYQTDTPNGYAIPTPQGALKNYIVVNAGGAAALDNSDTDPANGAVENGYFANTAGNNFFMTGHADYPDPPGGPSGDTAVSWDVGIDYLISALTIGGERRSLVIGFDFNQPQNGLGSLDVWALITVRDIDGTSPNINYELNNNTTGYSTYTTSYDFDGSNPTVPKSTDFVTVVAADCVKFDDSGAMIDIKPIYSGSCASNGYTGYQEFPTSKATNSTEFINFIPELDNSLEELLRTGYDTVSVQLRMGCFGGTNKKNGPSLADGGETTHCDGGGYGDVFLMAGPSRYQVGEPASMALAAVGLLGLAALRRRLAA